MRKSSGTISARSSPRAKTRTTELDETTTATEVDSPVIEAAAAWRVPSPGRKFSGARSTSTNRAGCDERTVVLDNEGAVELS